MVSSVASLKHLSAGRWPVASVRPQPARTESTTEAARTGRGAQVRAYHGADRPAFAAAAMAALLNAQGGVDWREVRDEIRDDVRDAVEDLLERLRERHGHGRPRGPKPHDPPPSDPPPSTEPPPPTEPPPVLVQPAPVVDDPAPARFLESVRAQLRADAGPAAPTTPFSQRNKPAAPAPRPAGGPLAAFHTPGVFTQAQAGAMRATVQAQAGVALLQAAQMSLYGPPPGAANPFRISAFA